MSLSAMPRTVSHRVVLAVFYLHHFSLNALRLPLSMVQSPDGTQADYPGVCCYCDSGFFCVPDSLQWNRFG